jgi:two-component system cell cycle sensor histidine kinase/response regulator CckA
MKERHRLLQRQIGRHTRPDGSVDWDALLKVVEQAYEQADEDRRLVERSLDLTSKELLERHEELRLALESAQVGTWSWSPDDDETLGEGYPNPLFPDAPPRFFGRAADLWATIHPEDLPRLLADLELALKERAELRREVRASDGLSPDRWLLLRGRVSLDTQRISGVVVDVTRQHRARQDALARERRTERLWTALQALTQDVTQGERDPAVLMARVAAKVGWVTEVARASVWLADPAGQGLRRLALHQDGHTQREPGWVWSRAEHPAFFEGLEEWRVFTVLDCDHDPRTASLLANYLRPAEVRSLLVAPVRIGGALTGAVALEHCGEPRDWVPEEQSFAASIADFVAVHLESQRRRQAEQDLEGQRAFLRQVIDLNPHLIFAKDRDGRFSLVNQAVAELYGTTVEALVGRRDADFSASPEQVQAFRKDDRAVLESGKEHHIAEERITDAQGKVRWLETVKRPIADASGRPSLVLGVSTDITVRKRGEEERLRLADELRQAQKMEAIGALAGGVAHDFNNLLMPILFSAEEGVQGSAAEDPRRELFVEIMTAGHQAKELTAQLLAFGRKQKLELRSLELDREIRNTTRILTRVMPENLQLRLDLDAPEISVRADPTQIQQVLLNLVINARDAMPAGGEVVIATRALDDPGGPRVALTVRDGGHGIPAEVLPRIFEPFFTTKALGKGTGLGLSTVYGIVQQHGGHIDVSSVPEQGSVFRILLPAVEPVPEAPPRSQTPLPIVRGESVLVVEDEPHVLKVVERILGRRGFEVLVARDGQEALAMIEAGIRPPDLLVTDIVLPGLDGRELYKRLRQRLPQLRALFMTGHPPEASGGRDDPNEGAGLLRKPFTGTELVEKVDEALARGL